jgi:hypothetical protein
MPHFSGLALKGCPDVEDMCGKDALLLRGYYFHDVDKCATLTFEGHNLDCYEWRQVAIGSESILFPETYRLGVLW